MKSLFWPTVENAWDVDYLGQQGFWICFVIAILSFVLIAISAFGIRNPVVAVITLSVGAAVSFVYLVGGMGVRQASWPAATVVLVLYVMNQLSAGRVGVLSIIITGVLLSNVRATLLASRWKPAQDDEDRPMRFNDTFRDKLVDQLPPRAWPVLKYPFYVVAVLVVGLVAIGALLQVHRARSGQYENATPSVTVTAQP